MLPVPISFLLSTLARLKKLLSCFSSLSPVLFGMNENADASTARCARGIPKWVDHDEDKQASQHCIDAHAIDDCNDNNDNNDDQDFLCARGCGQSILPGKEVRDGRALAAWRDWPFDGHDVLFDQQRDALAAAFAARLERHVAWIESAPLRVAARDRDNGPLSLYHYRYAIITAPTIVYTSTVWWTSMLVDEDAFLDGDDDDDNDNNNDGMEGDINKSDENRTADNGNVIASRQHHQRDNDLDNTDVASAPKRLLSIEKQQQQLKGFYLDGDSHHDSDQSGSAEEANHNDVTTTALYHGKERWRSMDAVDLRTATTRLCRRGVVVASETDFLVWRGSADDAIDQLDAIDDAAKQVHAILCFRPVDMCTGISVPVPY
ncbi:hypothetical protein pmac_cds_388 [Pandoravirus macleodensis]|uniref:Uncharacterized protein n=1 Tax=Pandoravirus macleodensis TaxID=2107707 RepID=A0A2U7UF50_9VIRU|nr:hypothetical protein pmac_cds_388 [Pandoravirus macleodensis]AVK77076.1 hypothetical protein pmac_cds_388 [Pandoravirus macleodensis]